MQHTRISTLWHFATHHICKTYAACSTLESRFYGISPPPAKLMQDLCSMQHTRISILWHFTTSPQNLCKTYVACSTLESQFYGISPPPHKTYARLMQHAAHSNLHSMERDAKDVEMIIWSHFLLSVFAKKSLINKILGGSNNSLGGRSKRNVACGIICVTYCAKKFFESHFTCKFH